MTRRVIRLAAILAVATVAGSAWPTMAQTSYSFELVNPSLSGLQVQATAGSSAGDFYEYRYVVTNAPPSTGALTWFNVDVTGQSRFSTAPADGNLGRLVGRFAKVPAVPVALVPAVDWAAGITRRGAVQFTTDARDPQDPDGILSLLDQMAPGRSSPPLVIRAFDPPGLRGYIACPLWEPSLGTTTFADETETWARGQTLGPVPIGPDGETFFRGGSNNPAVVDQFLTYRIPTQKTTTLVTGQKAFVVVRFGDTVVPGSFSATWNGQDVSGLFTVVPGRFGGVQLEPKSGRNVLVISAQGVKPSGGTATDTDRLLWQAP